MFICDICEGQFSSKRNLEAHNKRKFKCNIVTPYQCHECKKYFKQNKNLKEHITKKSCRIYENTSIRVISNTDNIEEYEDDDDYINLLLMSKIDVESKLKLIKNKINLDDELIKIILDSKDDVKIKTKLLLNNKKTTNILNANINNGTINTNNTKTENSNNITNNIQINSFGKEDISYLDAEYFKDLIMNQHIEKGYVQLIKDIYLNKEHPENGTVKVENINNKYALVYNNGKWDTVLKSDLKEMLHKKNYTVLKMHYDKLRKSMSIPKREETKAFLSRDETGDPHMMYVIDKIILLFYNGDYEEVLEKDKINKNV